MNYTHITNRFSLMAVSLIFLMTLAVFTLALADDNTRPVIISVTPLNDVKDTSINVIVTATFSKDMNGASINTGTFLLAQRTTPLTSAERSIPLQGIVSYDGATQTASFTPNSPIWPNQMYGNVYTATITTGVTDSAGNSLEHEYIWSFTDGT